MLPEAEAHILARPSPNADARKPDHRKAAAQACLPRVKDAFTVRKGVGMYLRIVGIRCILSVYVWPCAYCHQDKRIGTAALLTTFSISCKPSEKCRKEFLP